MLTVSPQSETVLTSFAVALSMASLGVACTAVSSVNCDSVIFTHSRRDFAVLSPNVVCLCLPDGHLCLWTSCSSSTHQLTEVQVGEGWCQSTFLSQTIELFDLFCSCIPDSDLSRHALWKDLTMESMFGGSPNFSRTCHRASIAMHCVGPFLRSTKSTN